MRNRKTSEHFSACEEISQEAEKTELRIHSLLQSLEGGFTKNDELNRLKGNIENIMTSYFDQHTDLEREMSSLLEDLKKGLLTHEELESLLRIDSYRSGLVSKMAGSLKVQLESLFSNFTGILKCVYQGGEFPTQQVSNLMTDMTYVMESVDFISKVVHTPAMKLNLNKLETDLRYQVDNHTLLVKSPKSGGASPTPKPKQRVMTLAETILDLKNVVGIFDAPGTNRSQLSKGTSGSTASTVDTQNQYSSRRNGNNNKRGDRHKHRNNHKIDETIVLNSDQIVTFKCDGSTQTEEVEAPLEPEIIIPVPEAKSPTKQSTGKLQSAVNLARAASKQNALHPTKPTDNTQYTKLPSISQRGSVIGDNKIKRQPSEVSSTNDSRSTRPASRGLEAKSASVKLKTKKNREGSKRNLQKISTASINEEIAGQLSYDDADQKELETAESYNGSPVGNNKLRNIPSERRSTTANSSKPPRPSSSLPLLSSTGEVSLDDLQENALSLNSTPEKDMNRPDIPFFKTKPLETSISRSKPNIPGHHENTSSMPIQSPTSPLATYEYSDENMSGYKIQVLKTKKTSNNVVKQKKRVEASEGDEEEDIEEDDEDDDDGSYEDNGNETNSPRETKRKKTKSALKPIKSSPKNYDFTPGLNSSRPKSISKGVSSPASHTTHSKHERPLTSNDTAGKSVSESLGSIASKIGGIIFDDKVMFIDPLKFINSTIEKQEEMLNEQNRAGNYVTFEEYNQLVKDVQQGNIENVSSVNQLSVEQRDSIVRKRRGTAIDEIKLSNRVLSGLPSLMSTVKEPSKRVLSGPIDEESEAVDTSTTSNSTINNNSYFPLQRGISTRFNHSPTSTQRETSPNHNISRDPSSRRQSTFRKYQPIVGGLENQGSTSSGGGEVLVIIAPSKREKGTDTYDLPDHWEKISQNNEDPEHGDMIGQNENVSSDSKSSGIDGMILFAHGISSSTASKSVSQHSGHPITGFSGNYMSHDLVSLNDSMSGSPNSMASKGFISLFSQGHRSSVSQPNFHSSDRLPPSLKPYDRIEGSKEVAQAIKSSDNPMLELYLQYEHLLSDIDRMRLYQLVVASSDIRKNSQDVLSKLYEKLSPQLDRLEKAGVKAISTIQRAQAITADLIVLVCSGESNTEQFKGAAQEMFRLLGEVDVVKVWIDLQLFQFRSVFESMMALGLNSLPIVKESKDFQDVYQLYIACQGKSVDISNRKTALMERCARYGIMPTSSRSATSYASQFNFNDALSPQQQQHRMQQLMLQQKFFTGQYSAIDAEQSNAQISKLQDTIEDLQSQIEDLKDDRIDLQRALFQTQQSKDLTPGAMLFYSSLSDQNLIPTFNQLLHQLNSLKKYSNGTDHVDFITLRQRLQVCLTAIPSIDKFLHKYEQVHRLWIFNRFKLFNQRGMTGGNADSSHFCPICHNSISDAERVVSDIATTTTTAPIPARSKSRMQSRGKSRAATREGSQAISRAVTADPSSYKLPPVSKDAIKSSAFIDVEGMSDSMSQISNHRIMAPDSLSYVPTVTFQIPDQSDSFNENI